MRHAETPQILCLPHGAATERNDKGGEEGVVSLAWKKAQGFNNE
jgi:hypothetical protein